MRCPDCLGLGATVEEYEVVDQDGYRFTAQRQKICETCAGSGEVDGS